VEIILVISKRVARILVEPILGAGGYVVPPDGFLPQLKRIHEEIESSLRLHPLIINKEQIDISFEIVEQSLKAIEKPSKEGNI